MNNINLNQLAENPIRKTMNRSSSLAAHCAATAADATAEPLPSALPLKESGRKSSRWFSALAALALLALPTAAWAGNATLSNLVPNPGTLNPSFSSSTFSYTVNVPAATNSILMGIALTDPTATLTVNGNPAANNAFFGPITLNVGTNVITIVIVTSDLTTNTYTVSVIRPQPGVPTILHWDATATGTGPSDGLGDWGTSATWWNGTNDVYWIDSSDAVFGNGGAGDAVTMNSSPVTIKSLTMNSFSGTYTLGTSGQIITLNNGIMNNSSAGATTIVSPVVMSAAQTWVNNSTNLLTIGDAADAIDNGGYLLTVGGSGNTTVSGGIGDTGGLTMNGVGTLTLAGANAYSGGTTISNGTVVAVGTSALPSGTIFDVAGGATLVLSGSLGQSGGSSANAWPAVTVTGAGTVRMPLGGNSNVGLNLDMSAFTGVLDLTNGMACLVLPYSPSFVSPTNGTIKVEPYTELYLGYLGGSLTTTVQLNGYGASDGTAGTGGYGQLRGDGTTTLNGAVILGGNSTIGCAGTAFTINAVISDGGNGHGFTKIQSGMVVLTATNTYSGSTVVNAGTLQCNNPNALGNSPLLNIVGSSVVNLNYTNATHVVSTLILGGVSQPAGVYGSINSPAPATNQTAFFAGTGTITVNPPPTGTLPTLTWDANGTGAGVVDGDGSWLNTTNTWWDGQANVNWTGTNNAVIGSGGAGGTITVGAVTAGQVTFTNFSGTYTLTNGTLSLANNVTVANSSGSVVLGAALGGLGGVTMNSSNTLTLAGANTYLGSTAVNAGTLVVNGKGAIGGTTLFTVAGGATLLLAGANAANYAWPASSMNGAGTVRILLNNFGADALNFNLSRFTGVLELTNGMATTTTANAPNFVSPTNGTIRVLDRATLYCGYQNVTVTSTVQLYNGGSGFNNFGALRGNNATFNGSVILFTNSSLGCDSSGALFTVNAVISDGGNGYGFMTPSGSAGAVVLNATNTFSGPISLTKGTLKCNNPGALGYGGALNLTNGVANLNYTGDHVVSALSLGGIAQAPGTYGSSGSPAANQNDSYFLGTGTVMVPGPAMFINFLVPGALSTTIDEGALTVTVTMPPRTAVTNLAPTYKLSSGTCVPASGSAHNFTSPVIYTVTDGTTTNAYTVTATVQPSYYWAGPNGGNWSAATNWNNTAPGAGNVAVFSDSGSAGATVNLDTGVSVAGLEFNNLVPNTTIGSANGSTLTLTGGGVRVDGGSHSISAAVDATAAAGKFSFNGPGTVTISGPLTSSEGGTVISNAQVILSSTGLWTDNSSGHPTIGGGGTLTINTGATLDWSSGGGVSGDALCVAFNGDTGKVVHNGGTVKTLTQGTAWLGGINAPGVCLGGPSKASTAEYDLNGGALITANIYCVYSSGTNHLIPNPGSSVFKFNGGTLQATSSDNLGDSQVVAEGSTNLMGNLTHAYVGLGAAKIDVATFSCGINQALEHDPALGITNDGGLHAMSTGGPGTLALYQLGTFTGPLAIDSGVTVGLAYAGNQRVASVSIGGVDQGTGIFGVGQSNPNGVFTGTGTVTVLPPPTAPVLPASSFSRPGGVPTFTGIATVSGYTYYLVYKTNLTDASWTPIMPGTVSTGSPINLTDPSPSATHRFYRIVVQ